MRKCFNADTVSPLLGLDRRYIFSLVRAAYKEFFVNGETKLFLLI